MNFKLAKMAIEMQLDEKQEKKTKCISLKKSGIKRVFNFFKSAFVTIPIDKN